MVDSPPDIRVDILGLNTSARGERGGWPKAKQKVVLEAPGRGLDGKAAIRLARR